MLIAGAKLGPYEIVAPIGAGGMGEVYRARDPRLGRDVAIKVVLAAFAADSERVHRFEQEARAAAALNHPNILAVYDIGQHAPSTHSASSGQAAAPYIVSELLEGDTLRERLSAGPLPVRKALDYAIQVARGLAAAHEKGIVHRDLKPENVFVTTDGRVKILDFGLAKLIEAEPGVAGMSALATVPPQTLAGLVLGTVGYMSPEQARGLTADHRADIFAFGAVLYEMLSGRRAFQRDTGADTMIAIVRDEPPDLPVADRQIPPALQRLVSRCLEKTPAARFQSASDMAFALEALSSSDTSRVEPVLIGKLAHRTIPVWLAAIIVAAAGLGVWTLKPAGRMDKSAVVRLTVALPPGEQIAFGAGPPLALSPVGAQLVYASGGRLHLRAMDNLDPKPIAGTEGATKLKKVSLAGGIPQTVSEGTGKSMCGPFRDRAAKLKSQKMVEMNPSGRAMAGNCSTSTATR